MTTDWIPYELMTVGKRNMVRWIHPGEQPLLVEPFFHQTVGARIAANSVQKLTPVEALADVPPAKAPKGFIFHVSRCGSTLVSRSLAGVARHRVIAEAGSVNQLLLADYPDPRVKHQLLKGLIHALCGTGENTDCFVKFTSWNLLFLEQILALFPATPWLFVYREPADVLRSLIASPPNWAASDALFGRIGAPQRSGGGEQLTLILERLFKAPLPHLSRLALPVSYSQLPGAIPDICAHFGLDLDPVEQGQIVRMGQFDAKQSGEIAFRAREREPLPQALQDAMSPLNALHQQWEQIRSGQALGGSAPAIVDQASGAERMAAYAVQDQRMVELIAADRGRLPDNELLANAYRRRGDLVAAASEYERLHAIGNTAPGVALFRALFNHQRAPARMAETEFAPAPFVQFGQVFDAATNRRLLDEAIAKQADFRPTELQRLDAQGNPNRTTLVTYDVGAPGEAMRAWVRDHLPLICECLNMAPIDIKFIQLKMASYAHGDFFKAHQDNGLSQPDRRISFVYYFHREPKPYQGGELLLYDSRFSPRAYVRSQFTRIIPQNNHIVFFPSEYFHEVLAVETANQDFGCSRFTMAGHIG